MKKDQVPQDQTDEFELTPLGYYATDEKGEFAIVPSLGWDAIHTAHSDRLAFLRQLIAEARGRVERGEASPLLVHMEARQFDAKLLAQYLGLWTWQVRRHLKPKVFAKLPPEVLQRYADFFHLTVEELCRLPDPHQRLRFERGSGFST